MPAEPGQSKSGYEHEDVSIWKVSAVILMSVLLFALILVVIDQLFTTSRENYYYNAVLRPESKALRELRSHEDQILNSYGVVDSKAGIYRIPIKRAMKLMADEAYRTQEKQSETQGGK
jgi:hypothetical protein